MNYIPYAVLYIPMTIFYNCWFVLLNAFTCLGIQNLLDFGWSYWNEKPAVVLPVTSQTQKGETGIESMWALYSDGRWFDKMAGLYPNRLSQIPV